MSRSNATRAERIEQQLMLLRALSSDLNSLAIRLHQQGGSDEMALGMYQEAFTVQAAAIRLVSQGQESADADTEETIRCAEDKVSRGRQSLMLFNTACCQSDGDKDHGEMRGTLTTCMQLTPLDIEPPLYTNDAIDDRYNLAAVTYNMGLIYYRRGSVSTAEQMFRLCLESVPEECSDQFIGLLVVQAAQNNLGHISFSLGEHRNAEHYFSQALHLVRRAFRDDEEENQRLFQKMLSLTINQAVTLLAIGEAYGQLDMSDHAMMVYVRIIETQRAQPGRIKNRSASLVYSHVFFKISKLNYDKGDLDMAIKTLEFSIKLRKELTEKGQQEAVAILLHDMGSMQLEAGRVSQAMDSFTDCLLLRRSLFGNWNAQVAETLYRVGTIHEQVGKHMDALEAYNEALSIERSVLDPHHPDIATTIKNIGQIYYLIGQLNHALEAYKEVRCILHESQGDLHPALAEIHEWIGIILLDQGNARDALNSFSEARRIKHAAESQTSSCASVDGPFDVARFTNSMGAAAA